MKISVFVNCFKVRHRSNVANIVTLVILINNTKHWNKLKAKWWDLSYLN